jgi:hypothetical protein
MNNDEISQNAGSSPAKRTNSPSSEAEDGVCSTGLQADYDLRRARYEKARTIEREVEPLAALQPVTA